MNISSVIMSVGVVAVLALMQYLDSHRKLKKNKLNILIFWILSLVGYISVGLGDSKAILAMVVSIALGILYLFASLVYFDATILKGLLGKTNIDEKICGGVILIVFGIGISRVHIGIVSIGLMVAMALLLSITYLFSLGTSMGSSALIGIGFALGYGDPTYISLLLLLALVAYVFRCRFRFVSAVSSVLVYIGYNIIFGMGLALGDIIGVSLGSVLYLLLPARTLKSVFLSEGESKGIALQNAFDGSKKYLISRVNELGKIFGQMDGVYRGMVRGNLNDVDAKKMLREELISSVCSKCPSVGECYRSSGTFMENCMDILISTGYEKGKILLIDLPEYLTSNCSRTGAILQYANNIIGAYGEYRDSVSNLDTSRLLIADQLSGVSKLLESLGREVNVSINFDNKYSAIIKENLGYIGVVCIECVVYESVNDTTINVIVKNNSVNDRRLEETVSRVMCGKYGVVCKEDGEFPATQYITLKNLPKYNIAFGSARATKSGEACSGDSYSVVDIGDGKYMLSICDGMGSGKGAGKLSSLTISLIENFYRAGFDNDIILGSVNKLLSLTEEENFSTIDLCLIDCKGGLYDFIKLGATTGYILHSDGTIDEISSSGLPVGVLEDVRPHITKKLISNMDIVLILSDGVSDVLGDRIKSVIRNLDTVNPQVLADGILSTALSINGGVASDDMTIIAVRVFENV